MASVARALARIKEDLEPFLPEDSILAACRAAGHRWRERDLGPVRTLHLFILQVLNFNTAMTHLRHLAGAAVTPPAFCRARMRLPLDVLQRLLRQSADAMRSAAGGRGLWGGLRVYLVDGSSTITPDTPALDKSFGHPSNQKKGCSLPVPRLLGLFDAFSGLVVEMLCLPLLVHEQAHVWKLHPLLGQGDLLLGDRGFCSFVHLAMLAAGRVQGCFRLHQRQIFSFRAGRKKRGKGQRGKPRSTFVRRLGERDQIVRWERPPRHRRPGWITLRQFLSLPKTLEVREFRYRLEARGQRTREVTIVTTLLDPALYPKQKVAELYGLRWRVETHFAELKTTLRMRKLKSKTVAGVHKELAVYCLVYNLVRAVMVRAAEKQEVEADRISFLDTVRWLLSARAGEAPPDLLVNPRRPDRHEPRVIKDLQDTYRKMSRPRDYLRKHPELTKR